MKLTEIDLFASARYNATMIINRAVSIERQLKPGKTLLILGPRRVGKTTLLENFIGQSNQKIVFYNGDNLSVQNKFSLPDIANLAPLVDGYEILVIDEAQNIANIGQSLKILNDQKRDLSVIAAGSSSFALSGQVGEPLVGRKTTVFLFPLSLEEILRSRTDKPARIIWEQMQEQLLIYGMYPNSVLAENDAERRDFLWELVDSLLLKDILRFQEIKGSDFLLKLLRLLAFQIGSEVSLEELGKNLGISKNTASRYLDLLEKSYIIFRLSGFNRNLRNEIKKMPKYYFYDIGVRNAVINNFNPVSMRDDIGKLWENFALGERIKFCAYSQVRNNYYFWRTWEQQEIDLIEETGGTLSAFEFKYSSLRPIAAPKKFRQAYPSANYEVISSGNFIDFVTNKRSKVY